MMGHAWVVGHHLSIHDLLHGELVGFLCSSPLCSTVLKPDLEINKQRERNMNHLSHFFTENQGCSYELPLAMQQTCKNTCSNNNYNESFRTCTLASVKLILIARSSLMKTSG